jgi:hypothetical protein
MDITGEKYDFGIAPYQFFLFRPWRRREQCQICRPIRRRDSNPAGSIRQRGIRNQFKSKLINVKLQAAILISDINRNAL